MPDVQRRSTIKDVARVADVSDTTVSRVIHNDTRVTDETRTRVLSAIADLDYHPNMVARSLTRSRSQAIGLIAPEMDHYAVPVIRTIAEGCDAKDRALMLFPTNLKDEVQPFVWLSRNWLIDGMLIYNLIHHDHLPPDIAKLQDEGVPFVFINKYLNETSVNAVGIDNEWATFTLMEHLANQGHRRFAFLKGDLNTIDGHERYRYFLKFLDQHGYAFDERLTASPHWSYDRAYEGVRNMLATHEHPTAIVASNDMMALGAMHAAQDAGLVVPDDISIVGYDDVDAGRLARPGLTTVRAPLDEVAAKALELLFKLLEEPQRPPKQISIACELIVRNSTGPEKPN